MNKLNLFSILFFICIFQQNIACKIVNPLDLLSPYKFSVMAKYIYAKQLELGVESIWGEEIYYNHLKTWNNCNGDPGKHNINDYIESFKKTLDSLKTKGFDPKISSIPIGTQTLVDGEHRLAGSLLYNLPVSTTTSTHSGQLSNSIFFEKKGLKKVYLDSMALQYAQLQKNCYIATLFPAAKGSKDATKKLLNKYGCIVYEKTITLKNNGPHNLIIEFYPHEKWIGDSSNNFAGARSKMQGCFPQGAGTTITVFLWQVNDFNKVVECKKAIRNLHKINNESIHINDTHEETVQLASLFFNDNSIHFLNNAQRKHFQNFEKLFNWYSNWLKKENYDKECFCIDSSAILSVYGLRDCRDLDFIHHGFDELAYKKLENPLVDSHNSEMRYHTSKKDEIIFNPKNHFYYRGLKFVSLEVLKNMKSNRNEEKDRKDVLLIKSIL